MKKIIFFLTLPQTPISVVEQVLTLILPTAHIIHGQQAAVILVYVVLQEIVQMIPYSLQYSSFIHSLLVILHTAHTDSARYC